MPALAATQLRKSFGPQVVLDDATLTILRGEKVGLIGANGAGKSTLARILAGLESPDAGSVSVRRGLTVRYLAQEPELPPDASARAVVEDALAAWRDATTEHAAVTTRLAELADALGREALLSRQAELGDAILRLGGWERGHEALGFLDRLGVRDEGRPCGERSGGERRRIALAQLLVASPDVAILDEPTNHLDADTAAWLEEYLADEFRGAVLLITHDRYFLDAVAQRIVELERGHLTSFPGGYGDYLEKKAERLAHEERVEQNRQNALRREREWLSRGPKARGTKQKARIQRAAALEAQGPATAGRPGEVRFATSSPAAQGKQVLELRGLTLAASAGTPPLTAPIDLPALTAPIDLPALTAPIDLPALTAPIDLIVTAGERLGVVGPNGAGKTTLLRAVLAAALESRGRQAVADAPRTVSGSIVVGKNTRVAYLDQARAELDDAKSIFDEVRGEGGGTTVQLGVRGRDAMDLRSYLELFLFDGQKQRQPVGALSGGERARVALAKVLREGANLLLFDEPTNDLDLSTLSALEDLLLDYEGSVLVVTHDRAFLDRVATGILAFEPDPAAVPAMHVRRYAGGYQDYVSQRDSARPPVARAAPPPSSLAPRAVAATTETTSPSAGAGAARPRSKGGLTYAERLELDAIVGEIDAAERRVSEVEALLADPSLYAKRGQEVAAFRARLEAEREKARALTARWELLEEKKEKKAGG